MDKIGITCLKTLFMLFNFIFLAFGLVLLVLGVWMKVQLFQYFETLSTNTYEHLPWVLVGIGGGILIVGILGCLCTAKGISALLYVYGAFLVIVFVAGIALGIFGFVMKGKVEKNFDEGLTDTINNYHAKETAKEAMDGLQTTLKCCGKNTSQDWYSVPWQDGTTLSNSVPMSCCIESPCNNTNIKDTSVINTEGCFVKVTSFTKTYFGAIGGTVIGFAFLQLGGATVAYYLAKNINKLKYEQMA